MTPFSLLAALPWLAPFLALVRLVRRNPDLTRAPLASGRLVSVIIPARNESGTIDTVVGSILRSRYTPLEILVVDDRSTDDTAERIARLAAADRRVRPIAGEALPAGWYGKPWACVQGFRAARGDLVLFTDADTLHAPELIGRAVGALEGTGSALVTISPRQQCITFWERVVMPQIWLLLGLRYHPRAVNRARRQRDVIANGQFILTTRSAYEIVGTHEAVRQEVAEDLALAQAYFRHSLPIHFAFAESLMETRMYQSLPALVEGWSKNIYLGGRRSFPEEPLLRALVPVQLAVALGFWLLPPLVLGFAAPLGLEPWRLAALLATGLSVVFWGLICFGMQIPLWYGLMYPVGVLMTLYVVGRSVWRGGRRVEWRGRRYRDPG